MQLTRSHFAAFVLLAGLASVIAVQRQTCLQRREENLKLREHATLAGEVRAADQPAVEAEVQPRATQSLTETQRAELLRLRAEVGGLRKQLAEAGDASNQLRTARQQAFAASAMQTEAFMNLVESRMQQVQASVPAFMAYVEQNHGQFPSSFEQARPFVPIEAQAGLSLMAQNFELTFQGSLTNLPDPASVIVMRQKEPLQTPAKGAWVRAYVFADGHSDVHMAPDGDFASWEQEHSPKPAGR